MTSAGHELLERGSLSLELALFDRDDAERAPLVAAAGQEAHRVAIVAVEAVVGKAAFDFRWQPLAEAHAEPPISRSSPSRCRKRSTLANDASV